MNKGKENEKHHFLKNEVTEMANANYEIDNMNYHSKGFEKPNVQLGTNIWWLFTMLMMAFVKEQKRPNYV